MSPFAGDCLQLLRAAGRPLFVLTFLLVDPSLFLSKNCPTLQSRPDLVQSTVLGRSVDHTLSDGKLLLLIRPK